MQLLGWSNTLDALEEVGGLMSVRVNSSMHIMKMLENNKHNDTHDSRYHDKHDDKLDNKHEKMHGNNDGLDSDDAEDDDLIVISDNDEIPNLKNLKNIKLKKYAVFNQKFFRYKFNLLSEAQTPYQGSRVI